MGHKRRVEIIAKSYTKGQFFTIEEARLRYEQFDGTMSAEIDRSSLQRGDSVAAVVHDREADTVILIEQFRYPAYENGPGWLLELPAGVVENDHDADPAATMRRELEEEIGYHVSDLQLISTFYPSPGGSSERIYVYYAPVTPQARQSAGGGLASEGEDIRLLTLKAADAFAKIASGDIRDAKTIIGLQWLQLQHKS